MNALLAALVELIKDAPELITAVRGVLDSLERKEDPTPAMKYATAIAMAKQLGLDPSKV